MWLSFWIIEEIKTWSSLDFTQIGVLLNQFLSVERLVAGRPVIRGLSYLFFLLLLSDTEYAMAFYYNLTMSNTIIQW
jgi:hypothetical protein